MVAHYAFIREGSDLTLTKEKKAELLDAMCDFVLRVTSDTPNKMPEEVNILPAISDLLLNSSYLLDLSERRKSSEG